MDISALEKQVFRKLLSNPEILARTIGRLNENDFTTPIIRNVIGALNENSANVAQYSTNAHYFSILLRDRIHNATELEHAAQVLSGFASTPVDAKDIDMLVRELKANRMCREMTQIIQKNIATIKPESVEEGYNDLVRDLLQLPLSATTSSVARVKEVHDSLDERVLEYLNETATKVPTGIKAFDAVMGGFAHGEFVVITAGTGQGKSNLMLWWAEQLVEQGYNSLYVTIEMSYEETMNRYHAIQTGFDVLDIAHRRIPEAQRSEYFEKLIAANKDKAVRPTFLRECRSIKDRNNPNHALALAKKYKNRSSKLFVMDIDSCTPMRVEREMQRICMDHNIDCVFVDFLNVMDPEFHNKDRVRELTSISREMKKVARKSKAVVFTAAQMDTTNLEGTQDEQLRPDMVKYARAIAENADWMIAFHRTEEDNALKQIRLQMAKHRHSSDCTALIEFDFANMQAQDLGFAPKSFIPHGYLQTGDKTADVMNNMITSRQPLLSTVNDTEPELDIRALSKLAPIDTPTLEDVALASIKSVFDVKKVETISSEEPF